jgi:hypothetical protein
MHKAATGPFLTISPDSDGAHRAAWTDVAATLPFPLASILPHRSR